MSLFTALKKRAIHETTRNNPKHLSDPVPDFEQGIFYLFVGCFLCIADRLDSWQRRSWEAQISDWALKTVSSRS